MKSAKVALDERVPTSCDLYIQIWEQNLNGFLAVSFRVKESKEALNGFHVIRSREMGHYGLDT